MAAAFRLPSRRAWGLLPAAALCFGAAAVAPALAADAAAARLERLVHAYADVRTLTGAFTQETRFAGFPTPRTYAGTVALDRPERMRWDYTEGSRQQVYVDGRTVTVYAPEAKQAVESTLTPASDRQVPLHLLADVTDLERTYAVAAGPDPQELVLTPREPAAGAPEAVHLWLDPDTGLIARVRLELPGGGRSDLTFRDVRVGVPVDPARFEVNLPEGVHRVRADTLFPSGRKAP